MLNLHAQIGMSRRLLLDQAKAKQTEILLFLSDPGKPGVRSLGPDVCPSQTNYTTFVRLN